MGFLLEQIAGFAPEIFTEEVMQSIAEELAQLAPVAAPVAGQALDLKPGDLYLVDAAPRPVLSRAEGPPGFAGRGSPAC